MKILIANWKMNPPTLAEAQELFRAEVIEAAKYKNVKTVICPPFMFMKDLASIPNNVLGAQDVFWEESDFFEPQKLGTDYALIGHSDRRYKIGETDEMINKKIKVTLEAEIIPVLLVGEKNREDDRRQVLEKQLSADLEGLDPGQISKVLIAYEPVWAISTTLGAKADTSENTLEALKIISEFLSINYKLEAKHFLYGGSVTAKNVADFLSCPEISGAVLGGASLRKDEFEEIFRIVSKI